jgi:hypothetical protein
MLAVVLAVASVSAVAGCTVPVNGLTGISVDSNGHLVLVLAWCGRHPDGITVYHDDLSEPDEPSVSDIDLDAPSRLSGRSATVSLTSPSGGWTGPSPIPPLDPSIRYSAYGWTRDNSYSTGHVIFQPATVATLQPGQILFQDGWDETKGGDKEGVVSYDEFVRIGSDCHRY